MITGKLWSFVKCCWFDNSDLIQTQNNSNIKTDEVANNYERFFNLNLFSISAQLEKDTNAINTSTACTSLLIKPPISIRSKSKIMKNHCRIVSPPHIKKSAKTKQEKKNIEAKQIAEQLKLDDRIEQTAEQKAFITIEDHKPNFPNNIKCRLINPAKFNLGKISKQILQKINSKIRQSTGVLQWRGTPAVFLWFKDFPHEERCKFLTFDVVDFYFSISQKLLEDAITFAKQFVEISKDDNRIIHHCRKSLLSSRDSAYIKNNGSLFDVTMDSYDAAEVCKLVDLSILHQLSQLVGVKNIDLYRDDGLAILENALGPTSERIKKKIIKLFHQHGLKMTTETNLVQTNFFDVTFNLKSGEILALPPAQRPTTLCPPSFKPSVHYEEAAPINAC